MTADAAYQRRGGVAARFRWDPKRARIVQANSAALAFWGEESARELYDRVFFPGDAAVRDFANGLEQARQSGGEAEAAITLRPRGEAISLRALFMACDRPKNHLDVVLLETRSNERADVFGALGFETAPRAMAVFDRAGGLLRRNEADRRMFPDAAKLEDRFGDAAQSQRSLAAALADGGVSRIVDTRCGGKARATLRRVTDAEAETRVVLECDPVPGEREAGGSVDLETIAQIAHDLRSPVAAARSAVDFLVMASGVSHDEQKAYLRDVSETCDDLMRRIERLVALGDSARAAEAGALGLVDLADVAERVWRLQRSRAAAAGATLVIEKPSVPAMTLADGAMVATVLSSLVDNALAHARPKSGAAQKIKIAVVASEPMMIEVSDNGEGLDAGEMASLEAGETLLGPVGGSGGFGLPGARADAKSMAARIELGRAEAGGLSARLVFRAD